MTYIIYIITILFVHEAASNKGGARRRSTMCHGMHGRSHCDYVLRDVWTADYESRATC